MKPAIKAHHIIRATTFTLAALGIGLLQGCGGGDGSSANPPPATTLNWSVQQTKTFHFTWSDVSGETEYRLLENPDGSSGYTNVATIAADNTSYDLVVSLPKRISAKYILQSCNDDGCTDSAEVSVSGNLVDGIGYMKAVIPTSSARFGRSVALSSNGSTLAVGVPGEGGNGAVYLYNLSGGVWTQTAHLTASNPGTMDYFGTRIVLSADGSTLAVGAYNEDGNTKGVTAGTTFVDDNTVADSGAVYVFSNSSGSWLQDYYIKASDAATGDQFGFSLALTTDGTTQTLAVGANQPTTGNGKVYLFSKISAGIWTEEPILTASNAGLNDYFGISVALASHVTSTTTTLTLAVGATTEDSLSTGINISPGTDTSATTDSGAVYLFTRVNGGAWTEDYIKASNTDPTDYFGYSVALSADGTRLAVGAVGEDDSATGISPGTYTTVNNGELDSGAVYLFSKGSSSWAQDAYIKGSNTNASDRFGDVVAFSAGGSILVISAIFEASDAIGISLNDSGTDTPTSQRGAAYFFSNSSGSWAEQAYIKSSNVSVDARFGMSLALSSDGDTLAVGAEYEDSTFTNNGAVYLY